MHCGVSRGPLQFNFWLLNVRPYNQVLEIGLWEFDFFRWKKSDFFVWKKSDFFDGKNPIFLDEKNPIFLDGKNPIFLIGKNPIFFFKEKIPFFRWIKSDFENPIVQSHMWWRVDGWGIYFCLKFRLFQSSLEVAFKVFRLCFS